MKKAAKRNEEREKRLPAPPREWHTDDHRNKGFTQIKKVITQDFKTRIQKPHPPPEIYTRRSKARPRTGMHTATRETTDNRR